MNKKILVVDDNEVNLELVIQLIGQYCKEKEIELSVLTAQNGQEAVELCTQEEIDLVFMDLMMPTMNGNEATKIIKQNHPHTMIIVISALGDEAKQKEMLHSGAEDYMVKPINAPLFKSRFNNYLQLIKTRNHISISPRATNLFTTKVYNYHMSFIINNETDLSEFWEALLIRLEFQRHIDYLSDFVRFIYRIGTLQLSQKFQFKIVIEEDMDYFFFTLDNIQLIGCEKIDALIEKYYSEGVYKCKGNLLSFSLSKVKEEVSPILTSEVEKKIEADQKVKTEQEAQAPKDIEILISKDEELFTFDILESDELEDFEDHLHKLRSILLLMQNSELEAEDMNALCHSLSETASILSMPNDTYVISNALRELSDAIHTNQGHFLEHARELYDFVNAFMNDLIFWKTKIFYEGAPSVDFLNDSITSNANMLRALLEPDKSDETQEGLDDIFDF